MEQAITTAPARLIVVADDSAQDRRLLMLALEESGHEVDVTVFSDGDDLLRHLRLTVSDQGEKASGPPPLVLLDLNMPRVGGREVLATMRADELLRRLPVVIYSTSSDRADIDYCHDHGANSYVVKPFDFATAVRRMKGLCDYWFGGVVNLPHLGRRNPRCPGGQEEKA